MPGFIFWEGARAVEWGGLENRCGACSTVGSNPTPPASNSEGLLKSWRPSRFGVRTLSVSISEDAMALGKESEAGRLRFRS